MKRNLFWVILLFIGVYSQTSFAQKQQGRSAPREIKAPEGLTYNVLQYREGEHIRAGQMAISYKDDGIKNKPVVVFIHGGGWSKGDKNATMHQVFDVAKKGFIGVAISYRLLSEGSFTNCIEDVKEAIRFLKSKQNDFPIDVDRIGVWGYSAGAHLALMIALSPEDTFHSNTYNNYDSKIKTVMAVSTPTDLVSFVKERGTLPQLSKAQNTSLEFQEKVSPITYITPNQIPVLMLHGTTDPLVKPYHYQNFKIKCDDLKVENFELIEFEGADHSFYYKQHKENVKPIFKKFLNSI